MNTTTQKPVLSAIDQSEALSFQLCQLTEIVRMAAFAVEAERTLKGVFDTLQWHPKALAHVASTVDAVNNWKTLDHGVGENLRYVADRLTTLREDFHLLVCQQASNSVAQKSTSGGRPHAE